MVMTMKNVKMLGEKKSFELTFMIMLVGFFLGHVTLAGAYRIGLAATLIATAGYVAALFLFLYVGYRSRSDMWKNLFGLLAGLAWWGLFGEAAGKLQETFGIETGIVVVAGNLPWVIMLFVITVIVLYRATLKDVVFMQWFQFWTTTWLGHLALIAIYLHPIFGGVAPPVEEVFPAIVVWSPLRIAAVVSILVFYTLVLIPLMIFRFRRSPRMDIKVASGYWFLIFVWSYVEVAQKLLGFSLYS